MTIYRCQHCKYNVMLNKSMSKMDKIGAKQKMGNHYETEHKLLIPPDMDGYRWFYYLLTKKDHGSCVECHNETEFNRNTMKYSRFCNNPQCKQKYKEIRDKRMMDKHGKIILLDDPEMQKKMQANRKISGIYTWSDKSAQFSYVGSYELDFLKYLDLQLKWPSSDLFSPSPHTYTYEYENKQHFYMPDFFIPSLSLEIEIKSSNRMYKQNVQSMEKEIIKDQMMKELSNVINYILILDKNYTEFNNLLKEV